MESSTKPRKHPAPLFLWPNLLGLDAPIVAICWQWFLAEIFQVNLPIVYHSILGLSVWCIYIADHLYDAKKTQNAHDGTPRLHFAKNHFRPLSIACILLGIANLALIYQFASKELIRNGLILSFFLAIYYALRISGKNRLSILIPREILCGFLFTLGTALTTWTLAPATLDQTKFTLAIICLALLCSANCLLISIWEKEQDNAVNDFSIASKSTTIRGFVIGKSYVLILIAAALSFIGPWEHYLAIALSSSGLALLVHTKEKLSQNTLRVSVDLVLLSPILILIATQIRTI